MTDIALVRLPKPFEMGPGRNIATIRMIIDYPNHYLQGKTITASGWGLTEKSKFENPKVLQVVDLVIVNTDANSNGNPMNTQRVLQARQDNGAGVCTGDSGGIESPEYQLLLMNLLFMK